MSVAEELAAEVYKSFCVALVDAALERAAQECDVFSGEAPSTGQTRGAEICAKRIRALKGNHNG